MIVDDNLVFKDHIKNAAQKANKVLLFVSRLMPNSGGPKEPRRRLLVSVVHSVILWSSGVGDVLSYSKSSVDELMRVHRRTAYVVFLPTGRCRTRRQSLFRPYPL